MDVLAHALDDTRGVTDAHYARMKRQNLAMIPTSLFRDRWMWTSSSKSAAAIGVTLPS